MLFLLLAVAFGQSGKTYQKKTAVVGWNAESYADGGAAAAACQGLGGDWDLCTIASFEGNCVADKLSGDTGFFRTSASTYGRGSCGGGVFSDWAPAHPGAHAHCCLPTYKNSGYNVIGGNYGLAEAEAYCKGTDFPNVCTVRQVKELSSAGETVPAVSSVYADGSVGWYANGVQERWDSINGWPKSRGAHCCSDVAYNPSETYGIIPEDEQYQNSIFYNGEDASTFCVNNGWSGLCTVGQLSTGAGKCVVGFAFTNDNARSLAKGANGKFHSPGYWGNCGSAGNGKPGQWNDHFHPADSNQGNPVAHCCMDSVPDASASFRIYRSTGGKFYNSKDDAAEQCEMMGPSTFSLCSRGQLKRLATESFTHNGYSSSAISSMCNNAWTSDAGLTWYQVDEVADGSCGQQGWAKIPGALGGGAHCCQDFTGVADPTPIYDTLKWAYFNKADAASQCRTGAELCTRNQLALLARTGVTYNNVNQPQIDDMCSQGWTKDAGLGWWQVKDVGGCSPLGLDQMNAFTASTGTYHCCLPFPAPPTQKIYETRPYFYYDRAGAEGMCGDGADLCTQRQLYRAASENFDYTDQSGKVLSHTAVETLCLQGWTKDMGLGWWLNKVDGSCGDNQVGWNSFTASEGTYHCCLPFAGKDLPTTTTTAAATTTTEAKTTTTKMATTTTTTTAAATTTTTEAKTTTTTTTAAATTTTAAAAVNNMPSARANPPNCQDYSFAPAGFEDEVSYCVADGIFYLGGYSTCIPADANADAALQSSWDGDWYFGASAQCTGRSADATTTDQLWVTNKMCDNLDDEITKLESENQKYMDDWKESVKKAINAKMQDFDTATQEKLRVFLESLE